MKKFVLSALILISNVGAAQTVLTQEFKSLVTQSKLGAVKDQTYCYTTDGVTFGYQPDKVQRIASVTKLFSTLLVSETLDLNKRFITKIYVGKDSVHIEGGRDPYFEEDKLLILIKSLNDLGFKSFKRVTFNRDFLFYDIAMGNYDKITPEKTRLRLAYYLNGKNPTGVRAKWQTIRKFAEEEGILLDVNSPMLSVKEITITDVNPLTNENPVVYVHESKPFHALLKTMNVQSKNYVAENVYEAGSKEKSFSTLMNEMGISPTSYKIYNGSGLPVISGRTRLDNVASCSTVLKIIEKLAESIKKHNLELSDVIAVNGGKDLGSFRERFEQYPETHEAVISKTGTLKHTSSLAGVLMIGDAKPFAILNHTTNSANARNFQDRFVSRMFNHLGTATPLVYSKISIFPWDGADFLKPLN